MISRVKNKIKYILKKTFVFDIYIKNKEAQLEQNHLNSLKEKSQLKYTRFDHPPIEVVNLNANDICNSKCVMCNIWEQKKSKEISPSELYHILKDPLFKNVKHIGVTGGEPTLREDLAELYNSIIEAIPNVIGLSSITNCIKEKDVIERIDSVIDVCKKNNKDFSLMISLDGYDNVHDKIRGRDGNFKSAINVYNYFIKKIPVVIGCTISKENVWEVDILLDYLKANKISGRFRVAEFIKRLYNDNKSSVIRNFNEDETYHLILFFHKLIHTFETNETFIRTYKSIINILEGGKRTIGCPYHSNGVVLNSKGEIAYCAPKSEIIGNALDYSALDLYKSNIEEKDRIIKNDCDNCIHDYHSPITYEETITQKENQYWRDFIKIDSKIPFKNHKRIQPKKHGDTQVFITGWYGTETVGDKAILAGIINELYQDYNNTQLNIVITSIYPFVTKKTLKELNIDAHVIPAYSEDFISYAKGSDVVIMGGGPLMDLEELALPLFSFKLAKENNRRTIVYGCGLGPLTFDRFINAVKEILNLSDIIKLRDQKSIDLAYKWLDKPINIELNGDPAKKYLQEKYVTNIAIEKDNVITCFLRDWTHEYSRQNSKEEFNSLKLDFELGIANLIKAKARELRVDEIKFDHMHNFIVGNDDRDFSRYFIKKYFSDFNDCKVSYNKKLSTVDSVANSMLRSKYNISMRFHSVVFAHTFKTNFTAIDYTRGGKIYNYLNDNNSLDNLISVEELTKNIVND